MKKPQVKSSAFCSLMCIIRKAKKEKEREEIAEYFFAFYLHFYVLSLFWGAEKEEIAEHMHEECRYSKPL